MVPAAQADGAQAADEVGDEVEGVEGAVVGKEALNDLGADAEDESTDDQRELETAAAGCIRGPVEYKREEEEGHDMEEFVVGLKSGWDRGGGAMREEANVGCKDQDEDEGTCKVGLG